MPRLPNEILDQIWLERCKLGFEPRILQAKWVRDGRLAVPSFYGAQPQAAVTQLCHGARQVAAKGFYSRISDNPFTGHSGFWWHKKDVLYVDQDFYRMLRTPRMAIFMGREYITRIAVDIQIDADATAITQLLLDWFPRLSQVFSLCAARLIPAWQYEEYKQYTKYKNSGLPARRRMGPGIWASPGAPPRPQFQPVGIESASTKSLPITTFCKVRFQRVTIPKNLFIRAQGLSRALKAKISRDRERALYARWVQVVHDGIPLFIFGREDRPPIINARRSQNGEEVVGPQEDPMNLEGVEDYVERNSRRLLRQIIEKDPRLVF